MPRLEQWENPKVLHQLSPQGVEGNASSSMTLGSWPPRVQRFGALLDGLTHRFDHPPAEHLAQQVVTAALSNAERASGTPPRGAQGKPLALQHSRSGELFDVVEQPIERLAGAFDVGLGYRNGDGSVKTSHFWKIGRLLVVQEPEPPGQPVQ